MANRALLATLAFAIIGCALAVDVTLTYSGGPLSRPEAGGQTLTFTLQSNSDKLVTLAPLVSGSASAADYSLVLVDSPQAPGTGIYSYVYELTVVEDELVEQDETLTITFTGFVPSDETLVVDASGVSVAATIVDDDECTVIVEPVGFSTESSTSVEFVVRLSNPVDAAVAIGYATQDATAVSSGAHADFEYLEGTKVFAAGETQFISNVVLLPDNVVERELESFGINVVYAGAPSAWFASKIHVPERHNGAPHTVVTIVDDDSAVLTISAALFTVTEGSPLQVTLQLTNPVDTDLTVFFDSTAGTVTPTVVPGVVGSGDLVLYSGYFTLPAYNQAPVVSMATTDDDIVEADETLSVVISSLNAKFRAVTLGHQDFLSASGKILNDDSAVISIDDVNAAEGDDHVFTVTMSNPSDKETKFSVATGDLTAVSASSGVTGDNDFSAASEDFTLAAGSVSGTFTVVTNSDTTVEADETFAVILSALITDYTDDITLEAAVSGHHGVGTIPNNDNARMSIGDAGTVAFGSTATFTVTLTNAVDVNVQVNVATVAGTAVAQASSDFDSGSAVVNAAADFNAVSDVLTFTPGQTSKDVVVTTNANPTPIVERDETFSVELTSLSPVAPTRDVAFNDAVGDCVISSTTEAVLSVVGATANEGNALSFEVKLSEAVDRDVSFKFTTTAGTASQSGAGVGDSDYTGVTAQVVTILKGRKSVFVSVATAQDAVVEKDETFTVAISELDAGAGPQQRTRVALSPDFSTATGTITNDDSAHVVVEARDAGEDTATEGDVLHFSVVLSNQVDVELIITVAGSAGTLAPAGASDYTAVAETFTFLAGEVSKDFSVTTTADNIVELDETIKLTPACADTKDRSITIDADSNGLGTITNDDAAELTVALVQDPLHTADEGSNTYFAFTLSKPVDIAVPITYSTSILTAPQAATVVGGPASADDFTAVASGSETFAVEALTKEVGILTTTDTVTELNEWFWLNIGLGDVQGRSVTVAAAAVDGVAGIIQNDDATTITVAATAAADEDKPFSFAVTLDNAVDVDVTFEVSTVDGTAVSTSGGVIGDNDFAALTAVSITIAAGEKTGSIPVTINNDQVVELAESFTVTLAALAADGRDVQIASGTHTGTINNEDTAEVSVDSPAAVTAGTSIEFTIQLSHTVDDAVKITFATQDGTAVSAAASSDSAGGVLAGKDYTAVVATEVTFAVGETSKTVTVATKSEAVVELSESFTLELSGLVNAGRAVSIGTSSGTGTITETESAVITLAGESKDEDNGVITFTATMNKPVDTTVTFQVSTVDGTATAGTDYTALSNVVVTIPTGQVSATFTVAMAADLTVETSETFAVVMSELSAGTRSVSFAAAVDGAHATATIQNDDNAVVSLASTNAGDVTVAVPEGTSVVGVTVATKVVDFFVKLSNPVDVAFTVEFATGDAADTAAAGSDYTSKTVTVTVPAGSVSVTVPVDLMQDKVVEADEVFSAGLSGLTISAANYPTVTMSGSPRASVTVSNDDSATVTVNNPAADEGSDVTINVRLSNPVDIAVSVSVATASVTAFTGTDYTDVSTTVTFAAGEQLKSITVSTITDDVVELSEAFVITMSSLSAPSRNVALMTSHPVGNHGAATIVNQQTAVLSAADASGAAGSTVTVTLDSSMKVDVDVSVSVATVDGTATAANGDFTAVDTFLTLVAGQTSFNSVDVVLGAGATPGSSFTLVFSAIAAGGRDAVFPGTPAPATFSVTITVDAARRLSVAAPRKAVKAPVVAAPVATKVQVAAPEASVLTGKTMTFGVVGAMLALVVVGVAVGMRRRTSSVAVSPKSRASVRIVSSASSVVTPQSAPAHDDE